MTKPYFCLVLEPPPNVDVTYEEKVEGELHNRGSFTVNVTWTHPSGMS